MQQRSETGKGGILFLLGIIAGASLLLLPAFFNGYPLVNSDDGTYINSGFMLYEPGDRPITYGLFLRVFSLGGVSLWIAAFVQAAVLSWLLLLNFQRVTGRRDFLFPALVIIALLSLITPLAWTASELIPDIWTAAGILSLALIVYGKESRAVTVLLYLVYFASVATHMSNLMIFTVVLGVFLLFKKMLVAAPERRSVNISVLLLLLVTWSAFFVMRTPLQKSKHVFFMAAMIDQGILKEYLADHCGEKNYKLCKYKDNLPTDANVFIWSDDSPLQKEGGWEATKEEYDEIIKGSFTELKFIGLRMKGSLISTARQLCEFHIAEGNFPFPEGSHIDNTIGEQVPHDRNMYRNAWQHKGNIVPKLGYLNVVCYVFTAICLLFLVTMIFVKRTVVPARLKLFVFLFLSGYLVNVWDCATFAQVNARYGSRMVWLIPFCALLCFYQLQQIKRSGGEAARHR